MGKKIPPKRESRIFTLSRAQIKEDAKTIDIAFSSEEPVLRFWGIEILDHDPSSVRMERFAAGLPFTVNHAVDRHVGVVENAKVGKKRLVGDVRFSKSASAREILQVTDRCYPHPNFQITCASNTFTCH